jgi:hypothetical protein
VAQLSACSISTEGAPPLLLAKVGGKTDGSVPALVRVFRKMREPSVCPRISPGSSEYRFEADILKDAKQLLAEKRKKKQASDEIQF